jgi:hypothetical protein
MSFDTTNAGPWIQENYGDFYTDAVYVNNALFPILGVLPARPHPGGSYTNWKVRSAGPTASIFTEGGSVASPSSSTYVRAYVSPVYIGVMVGFSGIAMDSLASEAGAAFNAEIEAGIMQIGDLFTTSFLNSTYGLELAIDGTTNYANITRASAPYWQSLETDLSTVLSYAAVRDMLEGLRDNDRGSKIGPGRGVILCPENQKSNFADLSGQRFIQLASPTEGAAISDQTFDGIPIEGIGDMTDTTILYLNTTPGQFELVEYRGFTPKFHDNQGDNENYWLSSGMALKVANPKLHGKHINVTA